MALTINTTPATLSWSRHPLPFQLSSDAIGYTTLRFKVEIFKVAAPDLLITTITEDADANKELTVDVAPFINAQLSHQVPDLNADNDQLISHSCQYYIKAYDLVDDVEGAPVTSSTLNAILGAADFFLQQRQFLAIDDTKDLIFLTARPAERRLFTWQEDTLTVLFTHLIASVTVRYTLHYTDDTTYDHTEAFPVSAADIYSLNIGFRHRDWNQYTPAKTIERISVSFDGLTGATAFGQAADQVDFVINSTAHAWQRTFIFACKHGGWDCLAATGKETTADQTRGEIYTSDYGVTGIVSQPTVDVIEQSSGYFPNAEREAYAHMRDINLVYLHLKEGELMSCTLRPQSTDRAQDGRNLNPFTFTYTAGTGQQDFNIINAISFSPPEGGGLSLPITIADVTGLQAALDSKASKLVIAAVADAATQAINCQNFDTCTVTLLTINRASLTWQITNMGKYLIITVDHTFAGVSTITLDTTNYEFTGQDGTVITSIELESDTLIIGQLTGLVRSAKPVIDFGIKTIDLT